MLPPMDRACSPAPAIAHRRECRSRRVSSVRGVVLVPAAVRSGDPSSKHRSRRPSWAMVRTVERLDAGPVVGQNRGARRVSQGRRPLARRLAQRPDCQGNEYGGGGGSRTRVRESSPAKTTCVADSLFRPPHKNRQEATA